MAHSLSAKKRVRQNKKHASLNRSYKSQIRTQRRSVIEKIAAQEPKTVDELRKIVALIQRVAAKGVVHKNKAANMVSRLSRRMHKMGQSGVVASVKAAAKTGAQAGQKTASAK